MGVRAEPAFKVKSVAPRRFFIFNHLLLKRERYSYFSQSNYYYLCSCTYNCNYSETYKSESYYYYEFHYNS